MLAQTKLPLARKKDSSASAKTPRWKPFGSKSDFLNREWLNPDEISKGCFTFLNDTADFGDKVQWAVADNSRLWRYNLHYFDYLFSNRTLDQQTAKRIMGSWVAANPPGTPDAWDAFPISLRLVNWIKYLSTGDRGKGWPVEIIRSTYEQTISLEKNLEYHLLANHFFKNGKALVFAGLFFEGSDANRWLPRGIRLLDEQIGEQILSDGGHFERSPMYHSMILEDCLDLINVLKPRKESNLQEITENLEDTADRMIAFLSGICHPDQQIALFNDVAFGIEMPPQNLFEYYKDLTGKSVSAPKGPLVSYQDTGYYVMSPDSSNRMLIDCGPIGPDYQPGHSHCDTLSFELSLKGRRVIVDSGCCQYEDGEIRKYNRGNKGHNTITIDGENQSEVWGAHRCARRAQPIYAKLEKRNDGSLYFEGAHDGYKRLRGRPIHHRRIRWFDNEIDIEDRIEGKGTHDIESRLHMHSDLEVEKSDKGVHVSDKGQLLLTVSATEVGRIEIEDGWYCPEFNKKFSCPVIVARAKNASLPFKRGWKMKIHN
jgi:uncharacterized heparinase superfamily protein